jgi:hypothetical protein
MFWYDFLNPEGKKEILATFAVPTPDRFIWLLPVYSFRNSTGWFQQWLWLPPGF